MSAPSACGVSRTARLWPFGLLLLFALAAAIVPKAWLAPLDLVGSAVCHRIPLRSFFVGQTQLPVCARDTGMFMGALLSMALLLTIVPGRPGSFPPKRYLAGFVLFVAAWAFDGFNSYVLLLRGRELFYLPQNWLRLMTGSLMGITLGTFALAMFNQGLWRDADERPIVATPGVFGALLLTAGLICAIVLWRPAAAYGPLALLSAGGAVMLLSMVNGMLAVVLRQRHGTLVGWRDFAPYFLVGAAMALVEIGAIAALRLAVFPQIPSAP